MLGEDRPFVLIRKKTILDDTCLDLVCTKRHDTSSNINIYNRTSTFSGPAGFSGQLAIKHATGAALILGGFPLESFLACSVVRSKAILRVAKHFLEPLRLTLDLVRAQNIGFEVKR